MKNLFLILFLISPVLIASNYPSHWWKEFPRDQASRWEILPQDARDGEVILSKRTELGIFSNLSESFFYFEGQSYASVEGFWQMLKYPDPEDRTDPRHSLNFPYSREEVAGLSMWESKKAGDIANAINKKAGINFVSYKGKRFNYKDLSIGSQYHYRLIRKVMEAKVSQNYKIKRLLRKTKGLNLRPDHRIGNNKPPAYQYHQIYSEIRSKL